MNFENQSDSGQLQSMKGSHDCPSNNYHLICFTYSVLIVPFHENFNKIIICIDEISNVIKRAIISPFQGLRLAFILHSTIMSPFQGFPLNKIGLIDEANCCEKNVRDSWFVVRKTNNEPRKTNHEKRTTKNEHRLLKHHLHHSRLLLAL